MSLDRRLREGFERATSDIDPDVERLLDRTIAKGHQRRWVRRGVIAGVLVGFSAAAVIAGPDLLDQLRRSDDLTPAEAPRPPAERYERIDGIYLVRLEGRELPAVADTGVKGTWLMSLISDGSLVLTPPEGFEPDIADKQSTYILSGTRFETDAMMPDICSSMGVYRYELAGNPPSELSFLAIEDDCAPRRALLSSKTWFLHQG
jgi:hypothetical protein